MTDRIATPRLLFYVRHFHGRDGRPVGGVATAVHGLASALSNGGVDTSVLCEHSAGTDVEIEAPYPILPFERPQATLPLQVSPALRRYIRALGKERRSFPDTLFVLNGLFEPSVFGVSRLVRGAGIPYVFAPHGVYAPEIFAKNRLLKWPYWRLFESRVVRGAAAVQLLDVRHGSELSRLRAHCTEVLEIQNGIASEDSIVAPQTRLGDEPVRLLFFGRIDPHHKGIDLLIRAVADLSRDHPLVLRLQGPELGHRRSLQRLVSRLGVTSSVRFVEPTYSRSPMSIMVEHDLVCLPSRYEGFGLSVLEAMVAGRVVLVSEAAGIARHVRQSGCGVLVNPSVAGVVEGLRKLVAVRHEWDRMGTAGREYALSNLRWKDVATAALRNYERLLGVHSVSFRET